MADKKVDSKKQADPKKGENKDKKAVVSEDKAEKVEKTDKTTDKKADPKKDKASDKSQKDDKEKVNDKKENNKDKKDDNKENKDKKDDKNRKDSKSNDEKANNNNNNNKKDVKKDNNKKVKEEEEEEESPPEKESSKANESKSDEKSPEEIENSKIPIFNVGDEVVLTKDRMGIVRFKGRVPEMGTGIFYGVELTDGSVGHNDGQVKGVRYFQTEASRAMFVGHEKIRRKMTARDHKRIDSFHAVSKNKAEDGSSSSGDASKQANNQPNQDDEKESVLSPSEQERQRQESLAQRDEQHESKELIAADGLETAKNNENIIQFILRQNNKYREILLDTYANPQTHITLVHAFGALQEIEGDLQLQGWNELIKRWQKFL